MAMHPNELAPYPASSYDTFPDFLSDIAQRYADRTALTWFGRKKEAHSLTYRQLTRRVSALRQALCIRGCTGGDHLAIISENSADWIAVFLAAASCGAVAVCVDTEQSDESIRDMAVRSDSRTLFLSPTFLPICLPLLDQGKVDHIVLMGGLASEERIESLEDLIQLGEDRLDSDGPAPAAVSPDQTAQIVFTSGTTSQSKMVMLSQKAILSNMYGASSHVQLYRSVFCPLPFYHAYGMNCAVLNSFLQGCQLFINGNLKTVMRDLHLAQPDTMFTVPLMVEAIHNQIWLTAEKAGKADALRKALKLAALCRRFHLPVKIKALGQLKETAVGSLRLVICGGAHLSPSIAREFELLGVQMLQGYGITECAPLISVNRNGCNRLGSVGLPLLNCRVEIRDGEVWAKGPSVMQGYYKDPEQTALALRDGWFNTGDLGYLDKDGFLYLTGRKKNLIVFKNGKKISPEKLEELIAPIPLVKEVLVSGTANGASADDVKLTASIYPDPERTQGMSSYEILEQLQSAIDKINEDLPIYQQIQLVNIREKEFSKTGTKKIKRHDNSTRE